MAENATSNGTDVAHTLADALQKIEHILADDRNQSHFFSNDNFYGDDINDPALLPRKVYHYAQELRTTIESLDPSLDNEIDIPLDTVKVLLKWLQSLMPVSSTRSSLDNSHLVNGNDWNELSQCRQKISRLENEKDSLLLQVSVLTDQVEVQGEKIRDLEFMKDEQQIKVAELEETLKKAESQVCTLQNQSNSLKSEISDVKLLLENEQAKPVNGGTPAKVKELRAEVAKRDLEIEDLRTHLETLLDEEEREKRLSACSDSGGSMGMRVQLREKASEVSRLKIKLERITATLSEKEKVIEELEKRLAENSGNEDRSSKTTANSSVAEDTMTDQHKEDTSSDLRIKSEHHETSHGKIVNNKKDGHRGELSTVKKNEEDATHDHGHSHEYPHFKRGGSKRSSFGKGFLKLKRHRSISEPNLSPTEGNSEESDRKAFTYDDHPEKDKKRNIVGKVFGKLRRSNSQGLESELKPHSNSEQVKKLHSDVPFSSWSGEMVSSWLEDEGLGQYADACASCIKTGDDLVKMSSTDLEKVFGMKKPLHRKKLVLALQAMTGDPGDVMEHLNNKWVLDWLDDIGLPQYKDSFRESLVDGRMLNYLTVNDVLQLKVHSTFHQHSLKRAIQCLRIHNFHPNYLKKSPIDESWQKGADVVLWTNHRVTEWLRQADLSEYATNLRGSGVHGSLMVLEPRFTAESMATLLAIPVGKKLLRRHLATHFESLVGPACVKVKETAAANGLSPILPGEKHKALRKMSIGSMKKRTKSDSECEEYVCPMDTEVPTPLQKIFSPRLKNAENVSNHVTGQRMPGKEQKGQDELTKTLGTFSKELNSLTDMLGQEDSNEK